MIKLNTSGQTKAYFNVFVVFFVKKIILIISVFYTMCTNCDIRTNFAK